MFVDSHCHLNYKGLVEEQQAVLARARAAGVDAMLNISTRASEWDAVIGVAAVLMAHRNLALMVEAELSGSQEGPQQL